MTLLDAREYDAEKARKKRIRITSIIVVIVVVALLVWWFRFWPQQRLVNRFFESLQKQDFKAAYAIWMNDPNWSAHSDLHAKYPFGEFYRDWGPGGEWGLIKSYKVYGASTCPGPGTGVVVDVIVNDRTEHAQVWVEKSDNTLSFPPCELVFR